MLPTMFVTVNYWSQVVEKNFSSIIFDKLFKIFSFPASWCIAHDVLPYWVYLSEKKIWNIHKHSLKYKILEEEFINFSSEAATRSVL